MRTPNLFVLLLIPSSLQHRAVGRRGLTVYVSRAAVVVPAAAQLSRHAGPIRMLLVVLSELGWQSLPVPSPFCNGKMCRLGIVI